MLEKNAYRLSETSEIEKKKHIKISVPYTDRQSYRFSHESKRGGQTGMHLVVLLYKMRTVSLFILDQPVQSSQQNIYKGQNVLMRRRRS